MEGMKFLTTALVTVALLMAGCTQNNETEALSVPLSFSTAVEAQTRDVTDMTTDKLKSMRVFAYRTQGDFNESTATPNFMNNQEVKRTDNTSPWTYSPVKYWPNNEKEKISFFAFTPYSSSYYVTITANSGFPSLAIKRGSITENTDYLLATPLMNKDKTESSIKFNFKHALAKVSFYVKNGDATAGKKVKSFLIDSRITGKYTFNETGFTYSAANTDMHGLQSYAETDIPQNTTDKVLLKTLFIHPDPDTRISLTYSINGNDANEVKITNQKLPATPALVSGANINYIITLNKDTYTITASNEKEWEQGSENKITLYGADDLKVGDYYYSDGSTSDGGLRRIDHGKGQIVWMAPLPDRILTNPQTNGARECIGVVFSTRMSENDKARGWTHGYVMGLSRFDKVWSPSEYQYDTPLPNITILKDMYNDLDGYDNTYDIKNSLSEEEYKLKHPLFYAVTSFAQDRPVGTSEWFLPSIGQMWDLYEVLGEQMSTLVKYRTSSAQSVGVGNVNTKINPHLKNAGGNEYMTGWSYWFSSTEYNASFAVLFNSYATNDGANMQGLYKFAPDIKASGKGFPAFAF